MPTPARLPKRSPRRLRKFYAMIVKVFTLARVAKLADARDLKSRVPKGTYRFDYGPGHQGLVDVASVNAGCFRLWKNGHCACFVLFGRNSFLNLLCSQPQISAGHDVVTIKNIARFVSADRHRYALRHTAPDHVAKSRAPKVVKNEFRHTTCFYQLGPSVTEIAHLFAILAREHKVIPLLAGTKS